MVKNPPANAGDMGSTPGPGGSHMPQRNALEPGNRSYWSHKPQSPCFTAREATARSSPHPTPAPQLEKDRRSDKHPAQRHINQRSGFKKSAEWRMSSVARVASHVWGSRLQGALTDTEDAAVTDGLQVRARNGSDLLLTQNGNQFDGAL